ncbi:MAG: DUF420 domain-containing protein [Gemmatimonadota bacterium]|nr:DUF420 domain-containing protein [Gemmatimonadota bacterium]
MDPIDLGHTLARINAGLNFASFTCLVVGFLFVKRRQLHQHRGAMTAALCASGLFLVSYVTRVVLTGTHVFAGTGAARVLYLGALFSHMVLAVVLVPLVLRLLWLLRRHRFSGHARLARWTYPVWLYVSITGIVVYVLLYHVYGYV